MDQTPRRLMRGIVESSRSPKIQTKKLPSKLPEIPVAFSIKIQEPIDNDDDDAHEESITPVKIPKTIEEEIVIVRNPITPNTMVYKAPLNWYEWILIMINIFIFIGVLYTLAIFLRVILILHHREVIEGITMITQTMEGLWFNSGLSAYSQYLPEIDYTTSFLAYLPEIDYTTPIAHYIPEIDYTIPSWESMNQWINNLMNSCHQLIQQYQT